MTVPATIRAGNTSTWIVPPSVDLSGAVASSSTWTLTTFLRNTAAGMGATVVGTARSDGGWDNTISATTSASFAAGTWAWESRITSGSVVITLGSGTTTVLPSLSYQGTPAAFDGRSQAEQDLAEVQAAIRSLVSKGSKAYTIGSRSFTSLDLPALIQRESQLKAIVNRERAAEKVAAGLGDPRSMFVRFT